jgi:glutamate-ammonia-ligase adenylyltransferase
MNHKTIAQLFPQIDSSHIKTIKNRLDTVTDSLNTHDLSIAFSESVEKDFVTALFYSEFIASSIARNPSILVELIESGDLYRRYDSHAVQKKLDEKGVKGCDPEDVKPVLVQLKLYESIRIAWRDLTNQAPLEETLEDLSRLAEVIVQAAMETLVDQAVHTYGQPVNDAGQPQNIIVLGMGKLGAGELNFSSDIDLIFVYPQDGMTTGDKSLSNGEFFTKVCRNFTRFFSAGSHETNFYRVDTRLRPFGDGGPIVMSAQAFEGYYQAQGREWERYAMIKARPIAGDIHAGNALLKQLNSFVYRRYFDYGSFDSFREMKQRIVLQVRNKRLQNNIKMGAGGIREIEFFGQLFQLIRGGVEPKLQERKILDVMDLLVAHRCIDLKTSSALKQAYVFLRRVENRLQAYSDLQTHDIPKNPDQQIVLACSMGYDSWAAFETELNHQMAQVHSHFQQLLISDDDEQSDDVLDRIKEIWANINDPNFTADPAGIVGFKAPERMLELLRSLESHPNTRRLTPTGRKKLSRLVPLLVKIISKQEESDDILVKLIDLIVTIERRTCYLSLLVENKSALETLVIFARKSPWIINFLAGHPALLDELMQPETLYSPPKKEALEKEMAQRMSALPKGDVEVLLEELCVFRQVNMLRVAAADISGNYPLMKVSDHLTYIAETVLSQVLDICWQTVVKKYGVPQSIKRQGIEHCGFTIVAYGKVGGFEMGYQSDLDIVFLHNGGADQTHGADRQVDSTTFYSYLGQRIINMLTRHTPAGSLYSADMRLRPGGASGMIVSQIEGYQDYMENHAWTWEHQALIRARPIAGDSHIGQQFEQIRKHILTRKRQSDELRKEVREMREKMRNQRLKTDKETIDLKQSKGGIVDIEFLVQYLILNHAHAYPEIVVWTDNIRLLESLDACGIIAPEQSEMLQKAYVAMRQVIHHLNLQEKKLTPDEDRFDPVRKQVAQMYDKIMTT